MTKLEDKLRVYEELEEQGQIAKIKEHFGAGKTPDIRTMYRLHARGGAEALEVTWKATDTLGADKKSVIAAFMTVGVIDYLIKSILNEKKRK